MFDIHRATVTVGEEGSLFPISSSALVDGMLSVASSALSPMPQLCGLERLVRSARIVLASFALVLIATGCGNPGKVSMGGESLPVSSARTERVVDDLRAYIPDRMESEGVPGLGVTLIEDGEIVWEAAFGVSNTLSGNLVTTESVFEVESIGKPVAAYAALKLVESGALELDQPIHKYLDQSWLSGSEWSDQITLRQLLSHTSGLSNRLHPIDKSISFEPGDHFSYSNVGFQYLQAVIEAVTDSSLDEVVHDTTFSPLAMRSSTFADRSHVTSRLVYGHINYGALLAPLAAVVFLWFAVIAVVAAVVQRIRTGHLALTGRLLGACYAAAAVLSLPVVAWSNGGINKWSFFLTLVVAALSVWLAAWVAGSRLVLRHLPRRWQSKSRRRALGVGSILLCITAFALVANAISGPVPRWPALKPGAAYSLKSTPSDLARFMIELSDPQHQGSATATEMVTPQIDTSVSNSWGLGIAIYHGPGCDWLWHAGDDLDFHALMVMCPQTGDGVIVLTNGDTGQFVTQDIARRAMEVDFTWSRR